VSGVGSTLRTVLGLVGAGSETPAWIVERRRGSGTPAGKWNAGGEVERRRNETTIFERFRP
jgi:hypothetical protein